VLLVLVVIIVHAVYVKKVCTICGGSRSPLDSLLVAGIDMRDPAVIGGAIEDFASAVNQFRKIYANKK